MARYTGSSCRVCRRQSAKLFLKGQRCYTEKCGFDKRSYAPGQHGKGQRIKLSNYGMQLREKQKVKKIYGILERQFRKYFQTASRSKGITGSKLLELLERRLDNIIFRSSFVSSRPEARQMVMHGHVLVNNKKVDIPSYSVKTGDIVVIKPKEKTIKRVKESADKLKDRPCPSWIEVDKVGLRTKVTRLPERNDMAADIREQLIVELYSK
ncbi:MAG: 30S ribosomal protein S4 [Omnitrophica bacterium GWA2_41_15]|nr:MAG: 30S ribosomal protein S4 [Omnitrophica bacterium GWA2_41_15]HAZ10889.1 30S ribosomal protein S4 [Candidatus Omnitrophota bacterium]